MNHALPPQKATGQFLSCSLVPEVCTAPGCAECGLPLMVSKPYL
jgi:hypothetical protein